MSNAEFARFVADLRSSEALRAEAGKIAPGASDAIPVEGVVAFASARGYAFTADEAAAAARELGDAELDGVVGGIADTQTPLSVQQQDALKAENLRQSQQADIMFALDRLLKQTIQSSAKGTKEG